MDYKQLLDDTSNLILEPDFQDISRQNVISSALECVNTKEDCMCQLLAWLLNPKEGHVQGEYFLKKLISGVYQEKTVQSLPEKSSALLTSYSNTQVMTEVTIHEIDSTDKKRRIDILLVDSRSKSLFIIERKDGSKAHSNQLDEYYKWANKYYPSSDWSHYFILLDSHRKDHGEQMHPQYVLLDDSWLTAALKNLLKRNALPPHIEHTLQDVYDFVFDEWDDSKDPYFKSRKSKILNIANQYSKIITTLQTHSVELLYKTYTLSQISPLVFYTEVLPNKGALSLTDEELTLFNLIQSNYDAISLIEDYSEFDQLNEQLSNLYPCLTLELGQDTLNFSLKKHEYDKDEYWPYYLEIERIENEYESSYILNAVSSYDTHESCLHIAKSFAELYKFPPSRKKTQTKVLLENIANLDVSHRAELRSAIDTFVTKANSLPEILK